MTFARFVASGFGSGLVPWAPGTAGSVAAVVIGVPLLWAGVWWLVLAIVVACAAGIWAIPVVGGDDDPGWVVIDEFAGQWIALLGVVSLSWEGVVAAFVLFRFFDIAKPWLIDRAQGLPGAWGVMADDVLAGAVAGVLVWGGGWVFG
jgi:phosphatidylglycerophosphatase A